MNVGNMHLLALLVRDVGSNQELVEKMTNIKVLAKIDEENNDIQTIVLNFALEISGVKSIYVNKLNDHEFFIEHFMD